ncbi:MAG: TetR-like C-terminal domain-containing protein [Bacilli bacterium]|jgi:AcrR family transcriptional regulator
MDKAEEKTNDAVTRMSSALMEILSYKSFLNINVKELCLVAKVNRTTFYAHYGNTFELLEDTKNRIIKKFLASYGIRKFSDIQNNAGVEDLITEEFLLPYLSFIKENHHIYEVYVNNSLTFNTEEYFDQLVKNISKPMAAKKGLVDEVALSYVSRFYVDGINSIVRMWINRHFKESKEEICQIILSLRNNNKTM